VGGVDDTNVHRSRPIPPNPRNAFFFNDLQQFCLERRLELADLTEKQVPPVAASTCLLLKRLPP
jgi:hypothetical protein